MWPREQRPAAPRAQPCYFHQGCSSAILSKVRKWTETLISQQTQQNLKREQTSRLMTTLGSCSHGDMAWSPEPGVSGDPAWVLLAHPLQAPP